MRFTKISRCPWAVASALWCTPTLAADEIVVGFCDRQHPVFMQGPIDKPAQDAGADPYRRRSTRPGRALLGKKDQAPCLRTPKDRPGRGRQSRPRGARSGRRAG